MNTTPDRWPINEGEGSRILRCQYCMIMGGGEGYIKICFDVTSFMDDLESFFSAPTSIRSNVAKPHRSSRPSPTIGKPILKLPWERLSLDLATELNSW